ncbi:MAG: EamA family transporter [Bacteroidetes bacterium]|nr:EamA family transporter [Bacteroidota bacterium]
MKKALLSLHLAIILAGFTGVLGRLITLNEGLLVWWRMFITVITLLLLFLSQKRLPVVEKRLLLKMFGTGSLVALHWVFFYGSIKYANVSIGLVCFSAIGFFTAFIEPAILKRRIDFREVILGGFTIAGIALIFHFDDRFKLGIMLGTISSFFAALFPVLNKKLLKYSTPQIITFYEMAGGLFLLSLIMPLYLNLFPADHILPTSGDWLWLLVLSWFCTVIAFNLSVSSLKRISPFTVSLSYNLEPLYGIILAFLLYKENQFLGTSFYYGLILICVAVFLQTYHLYKTRGKHS